MAISKAFVTIADGSVDPDSPIDAALMTGLRDNDIHLREWLGAAYYAGADQNHTHNGVNSALAEGMTAGAITTGMIGNEQVTALQLGSASVAQGKLKTTSGVANDFNGLWLPPGGEYGFLPQLFPDTDNTTGAFVLNDDWGGGAALSGWMGQYDFAAWANYLFLATTGTQGNARQRYVTASPPYDYGHGIAHLFVFVKLDKSGNRIGISTAIDPPWAYCGPTRITPDFTAKDGKKYQLVISKLAAERGEVVWTAREVTQEIKNADMDIVTSPFGLTGKERAAGVRVALLDPMSELMARLAEMQGAACADEPSSNPRSFGFSPVGWLAREGHLQFDNEPLDLRSPRGVMTVAPKMRKH